MTNEIEAIYENGVLKPANPLSLAEGQRVRLTIRPASNWVEETAGILGWTGSAELAARIATDADLDHPHPVEEP